MHHPTASFEREPIKIRALLLGFSLFWVAVKEIKLLYWGNPIIYYIYPLW